MDDEELKELQNPDTWEDMEDGKRPPVKASRAIVSVAFGRDDFELVSETAYQHGEKLSEFIRNAAIDRARATTAGSTLLSISGSVRSEYELTQPRGTRLSYSYTTKSDQVLARGTA